MDEGGFPDSRTTNFSEVAVPDRRGAERHRAVCRIARVARDRDIGLWRVRNISDEGLQLAADVPVAVGERVEISLSETIKVEGRIVWAKRGRCGVAFKNRIDAAATLHALAAEQRAEGYRALRLPVAAEAILITRNGSLAIDLVNISQQGAGYICDALLEPGSELELVLPGGERRRRALVRWARGKRGGLWFTQPLDRSDLESIGRFGAGGDAGRARNGGMPEMIAFVTSMSPRRMAAAFKKSRPASGPATRETK